MQTVDQIIKDLEEGKKEAEFMRTKVGKMDDLLDGGFLRKEMIVLGGNTGSGKSYFAGTFFFNIASQGFKCAYFSLEISNKMVLSRLIGQQSNIKPIRIMTSYLDKQEQDKKLDAQAKISAYSNLMTFYDNTYELKEIAEEIKKNEYEFVVVDFLQNIVSDGRDEYARMSHVALELQRLAKFNNCCILALSQVSNKQAVENKNKYYVEYKGSGSIATVCDLGLMIVRDDEASELSIEVRKNRRGISGERVLCQFIQPGGLIV